MTFKVAIVVGQLGYGGTERQVSVLAKGLAESGWPVTVVSLSGVLEPFGDEIKTAGVGLRWVPRDKHYEFRRILRLAEILRQEKAELVHSHLETANIYSYLARPLAGRPAFIPSVRSLPVDIGPVKSLLTGRSLKAGHCIHANCHAAARSFAERYGIELSRFRLIHNSVSSLIEIDPETRLSARKELNIPQNSLVVATLSKDAPDKNISAFLRLAKALFPRFPNLSVLVAGLGLDESYPGRNGLDRAGCPPIFFLGPVRKVSRIFAAADLFVLTSIREGLPNVVMEAMVSGLPVVSYAAGGVEELIEDGVSGRLVPCGDEAMLFEAACSVLENREFAWALGKAGRKKMLEDFSTERMIAGTTGLYREILSGQKLS